MKRLFIGGLGAFAVFLIVVVVYQVSTHWIILRPGSLLGFSASYNEFRVQSDFPVRHSELKPVLDDVTMRLRNILDYGAEPYTLFLIHDPETFAKFARKAGRSQNIQGFNLQPLNYVFINRAFIREVGAQNIAGHRYSILEGSESHIIAHEICHELISRRIGFWNMRNTARWKQEGFCEYAASANLKKIDASYRFEDLASAFFAGDFDRYPPGRKFYVASGLAVEYFLDRKRQSFDDLFKTEAGMADLLEEIKAWK